MHTRKSRRRYFDLREKLFVTWFTYSAHRLPRPAPLYGSATKDFELAFALDEIVLANALEQNK